MVGLFIGSLRGPSFEDQLTANAPYRARLFLLAIDLSQNGTFAHRYGAAPSGYLRVRWAAAKHDDLAGWSP